MSEEEVMQHLKATISNLLYRLVAENDMSEEQAKAHLWGIIKEVVAELDPDFEWEPDISYMNLPPKRVFNATLRVGEAVG